MFEHVTQDETETRRVLQLVRPRHLQFESRDHLENEIRVTIPASRCLPALFQAKWYASQTVCTFYHCSNAYLLIPFPYIILGYVVA